MDQENRKNLTKKSKSLNDYARYSGMAFQMIAILGLGVWGGIKLDDRLNMKFPLFTVVLSFAAVLLALYTVLKDFLRMKKK
jgi:ATP synthase protein I